MFNLRIHARFSALIMIFVVGQLCPSQVFAEFDGDNRSWQTLGFTFHDGENWRIKGAAQTRLYDDSKFLGTWLLTPTVEYKLHPNLNVGVSYLLEDIRAEAGGDYTRLHIFWLHASPHWQLNEQLSFSMRHLVGYRAIESRDNCWVTRHRFSLSRKLDDCGALIGVGMDTELIYNCETDRFYENRFKPLKLTFSIDERTKFQFYCMLQSKRFKDESDWETAYVFGQTLVYSF